MTNSWYFACFPLKAHLPAPHPPHCPSGLSRSGEPPAAAAPVWQPPSPALCSCRTWVCGCSRWGPGLSCAATHARVDAQIVASSKKGCTFSCRAGRICMEDHKWHWRVKCSLRECVPSKSSASAPKAGRQPGCCFNLNPKRVMKGKTQGVLSLPCAWLPVVPIAGADEQLPHHPRHDMRMLVVLL